MSFFCGQSEVELRTGRQEVVEPFELSAPELQSLYVHGKEEECLERIRHNGGGLGVVAKLKSDPEKGLSGDQADLEKRLDAFGENKFPEPPFESWFSLFFESFKDTTLIILIVAAVVSLIVGSIPAISDHPDTGWIDGVAILIAVLIVASVTATNDYNKQLQFRALHNESKARIEVQIFRNGTQQTFGTHDLVVGDIVHLETGTKIPADGLVLRCNDFKTNESAVTGESDDIKKDPAERCFLLSGSQVAAGTCDFVVTAVGVRSMQGAIMSDTAQEDGDTPLQVKLDKLAGHIGKAGFLCAFGTFIALIAMRATDSVTDAWGPWVVHSIIYAVTVIVVAIPEGLPLAVTIALAYSTRKMLADQNLIRHLAACETMGNATDICSDKTGTLTENRMTIVQAWVGGSMVSYSNTDPVEEPSRSSNWNATPPALREQLRDQLALNATAVTMVSAKGKREVKGSKTEGAGVMLVESFGYDPIAIRQEASRHHAVVKQYSFSSERKMMSTIIALPDGRIRMYTTGGSDFVLAHCRQVEIVSSSTPSRTDLVSLTPHLVTDITNNVIVAMARQSLRTLAVAYRDFASRSELPEGYEDSAPEDDLTLYAVVGIKDPLRKDVAEAVATCQAAGVTVRMVTGDNKVTATAIAKECGILTEGGLVMEGPDFRALTPSQLDEILPRLVVLARSSPRDKNILVRRLNGNLPKTADEWAKEHPDHNWSDSRDSILPGYFEEWAAARKHIDGIVYKAVVGVTGDGTNDAPALKAADVGLSMGISGTQVAMDASDIVILDDRFSSIVRAVMWGRNVYDNVQSFLQFQLTVNVVALAITFISAVMQKEPPLNPIMMLWVNLIMDTMGALALATEAPTPALLQRKPYSSAASLVSYRMWRHIICVSSVQLAMMLALVSSGATGLGVDIDFLKTTGKWLPYTGEDQPTGRNIDMYISTFIFNAFVFAQLFNEFNARSLTDRWNVWKGLEKNYLFLVIIFISIGVQALFVELGGKFTKTTGLAGVHWGYSIALGALTVPVGILMRFIPVPQRPKELAVYYTNFFRDSMLRRGQMAAMAAAAGVVGSLSPGQDASQAGKLDATSATVAGSASAVNLTHVAVSPRSATPAASDALVHNLNIKPSSDGL